MVVEDLSPDIIEQLGSLLEVDPEAFALQLSRARPSKSFPADDEDIRWNTSGMAASYSSIQWYRPVKVNSIVSQWLKEWDSLRRLLSVPYLGDDDDEEVHLSWHQKQVKHWKRDHYNTMGGQTRFVSQKDIHHRARIETNIFRRSRPLSTKIAKASNNDVSTAWEERATIFKVENATVPPVSDIRCQV